MSNRFLAAATATLSLTAVAAPAADAAKAPVCAAQPARAVFAPWGDRALFAPVTDGGFDAGLGGWTVTGAATAVAENEPLLGAAAGRSLQLAPGASATSPAFCIDATTPYARAFARSVGPSARVEVDAQVLAADGSVVKTADAGRIDASGAWAPTPKLNLPQGQARPDGRVRLRFMVTRGSAARIDDVFVDPRLAK